MPVTVHEYHAAGKRLEPPDEPIAVDQGRADALRQRPCRARILDDVMMENDDPAGIRVLRARGLQATGLIDRNHAERIGEREMRIGIRVEQDDAQGIVPTW